MYDRQKKYALVFFVGQWRAEEDAESLVLYEDLHLVDQVSGHHNKFWDVVSFSHF